MRLIKRVKLEERKITENDKIEFQVVFVNAMDSAIVTVNEKNYEDLDSIRDEAYKQFLKQDPNASDDFWIDDISLTSGPHVLHKLDWNKVLNAGGNIDEELFGMILEDPDTAVKLQYLAERGYKSTEIDESLLETVYIYDASRDNIVEGNHGSKYPEGWVDDYIENFLYDLNKDLEKYDAVFYMDYPSLISDREVNGEFDSAWIGDYFVTGNN